jgi:hypothetical protein
MPGVSMMIRRHNPEDFLICFSYDDMVHVLHDPPPIASPFILVFKRWHCQLMASAVNLFFRVMVALHGIPTHVCICPQPSKA